MPVNPYAKYKEQSILTMTPGEMVVKLYEEVENQLNRGIVAIREKNIEKSNASLQKAQKIINHLKFTLNHDYEVSAGLASLYDFFNHQIIKANIRKDVQPIQDILPLVVDLKETFAQGEKLARIG